MKRRFLLAFGALLITLLLAACGGTATTNIQVTETDFHISSTVTSFSPGIAYHFVVTNNGNVAHEFMIMPTSEESMNGMSMGTMDKLALASISQLNPGETKTLDYTFSATAAHLHLEFACHLPGHYEAGMKQAITVQP